MKLVDKDGHALGRQYHCSRDGKKLNSKDLIRGYESEDGKMIGITDAEFESVAPEMSSDIRVEVFVPGDQIPPLYFQRSYFLSPGGKSSTAYNLLVATMKRAARVGIGSFVMRGHEYLVAIVSDNGVLRADTLRYADEVRTPRGIDLPARVRPPTSVVAQLNKNIEALWRNDLDMDELEDKESGKLLALVKAKKKSKANIIHQKDLETDDTEGVAQSAKIIDLTAILRRSLSKRVVVTNAQGGAPISLDERRILKRAASGVVVRKKKFLGKKSRNK